ncbi:MAG: metal-dependent hydrolase [Cellvibrionaceae bacterium]
MDPLTQGVVAAVASQQVSQRKHIAYATLLGFFSGMTPDLDVLIKSDVDPLLALEYHRHFTHSLFFIPVGGLLCALVFYALIFRRPSMQAQGFTFKRVWLYCTLGYATHGLLDACTTYGTQLLWPLSDMRVAWNTISIIDPIFTLPLLTFIVIAALKKSKRFAHIALVWVVAYTAMGIIQRERAESVGLELAASRGHTPLRLEAKPSFANIVVWKTVYSTDDAFYVDAVKVGLGQRIYEGASVPKLNVETAFPWLDEHSQQRKDIERFRWFSNRYLAVSPQDPTQIIDVRYSMIPNEIRGLWGIQLDERANSNQHVNYVFGRDRDQTVFKQLWKMIVE